MFKQRNERKIRSKKNYSEKDAKVNLMCIQCSVCANKRIKARILSNYYKITGDF